jgi:hypothetical protein
MIYPEYLDLFDKNKINIDKSTDLILHVKIVNIKRQHIAVWYKFENKTENIYKVLYNGKLPRKDLAIPLPITNKGKNQFEVVFVSNGEELFRIWGEYQNEGGDAARQVKSNSNH